MLTAKCNSLITSAVVLIACLYSCCPPQPVEPEEKFNNVAILYSCGRNSLSYALNDDISDMCDISHGSWLPEKGDGNAMIVVSHQPGKTSSGVPSYDIKSKINVIRLYAGANRTAVRDTVGTFSEDKVMTDPDVMQEILQFIHDKYVAEHYGMVLSSHGSGWLPEGYLYNYTLNSFGEERQMNVRTEMDIRDMATHFPYHMDYLLFDSCLMGNVETVYELRKCADLIGVSPTEVVMEGFNYKTLAANLLKGGKDGAEQVCRDYFKQYENSGKYSGATIALIRTDKLDELAEICRGLFSKYGSEIASLDISNIQHLFKANPWFFDMEDVVSSAVTDTSDLAPFEFALADCIVYSANTAYFLGYPIYRCCGLAMFLPQSDRYLGDYYRSLAWNKDTGLIQ